MESPYRLTRQLLSQALQSEAKPSLRNDSLHMSRFSAFARAVYVEALVCWICYCVPRQKVDGPPCWHQLLVQMQMSSSYDAVSLFRYSCSCSALRRLQWHRRWLSNERRKTEPAPADLAADKSYCSKGSHYGDRPMGFMHHEEGLDAGRFLLRPSRTSFSRSCQKC